MSIEHIYKGKEHESYFSIARKEIVPLIPSGAQRVMEFGCGEGATLAFLKKHGMAEWTCGVDVHDEALQKALLIGVDEIIHADVENLSCLDAESKYDVILCLDVLEHLVDPWTVIKRISSMLTDKGVIIASIPNVQNLRVIFPLIFGSWTYKDCGILDNGHLRFFTKKSALELMKSGGLCIDRVMQRRENHWLPRLVNAMTLGIFSRFVTVQYIIRVHPCDENGE